MPARAPLAPQTVKLQQNHVHAALTALVESGISPKAIRSLGDLVTIENFKRILRRRLRNGRWPRKRVQPRPRQNAHRNCPPLGQSRCGECLRSSKGSPAKFRRRCLALRDKNKTALRQFDDPDNLRRLFEFSSRLWAEVKAGNKSHFRTLVKAQAAIAVGILCYMPMRPQNLWALKFDEHIFLHEGPGAISSLELPASEVKNRTEIAFDIPPHLAKMLIEYRNRIAPKVIGRRPDRLFVKADGTAKNQWAVSWLIRTYLRKRAGLQLSPHQFRHLGAKVILDAEPGNFETVRQLLGHKSAAHDGRGVCSESAAGAPHDIINISWNKRSLCRSRSGADERGGRSRAGIINETHNQAVPRLLELADHRPRPCGRRRSRLQQIHLTMADPAPICQIGQSITCDMRTGSFFTSFQSSIMSCLSAIRLSGSMARSSKNSSNGNQRVAAA